jgi:hypothetical protein
MTDQRAFWKVLDASYNWTAAGVEESGPGHLYQPLGQGKYLDIPTDICSVNKNRYTRFRERLSATIVNV